MRGCCMCAWSILIDACLHCLKQAWWKNNIYPLILISDVLRSFLKVTGPEKHNHSYWNYTGEQIERKKKICWVYDDWHAELKFLACHVFFSTYPSDKQTSVILQTCQLITTGLIDSSCFYSHNWDNVVRCVQLFAALYGIPIDTLKPSAFPSCLSTYSGVSFLNVTHVDSVFMCCWSLDCL